MNEGHDSESEIHRRCAARFFNDAWTLIDKPNRTADDDLRMIHLAHASRLHWEFVGDASNLSIGEWQISRVYSILGFEGPALYHARNCLRITTDNRLKAFLQAYSFEAMARALALTGEPGVDEFIAKARKLAEEIEDSEDRALLETDLSTIDQHERKR